MSNVLHLRDAGGMTSIGSADTAESVAHVDRGAPIWRFSRKHLEVLAVLVPGLLVLASCIYQMGLPNALLGPHDYGEGVYLGAAIRLLQGVAPYRDFVLLHPPGILLLMAPVAALSKPFGTVTSLAVACDVTMLVAAANASLAAFAVRHRGIAASLVAGIALACFPLAVADDCTLLLEPYLTFFCLVGIIFLFEKGRLAPTRRLFLGGLALGFGGAIKIWAVLIIAAALVVCLTRWRTAVLPVVGGAAAGFVVPCLPFFLTDPHAFVRDIFVVQSHRVTDGATASSVAQRVTDIMGVTGWSVVHSSQAVGVGVGIAFLALSATTLVLARRTLVPVDWVVILASVASCAALLRSSSHFVHYVYFSAAFIAMLFGICFAAGRQWLATKMSAGRFLIQPISVAVLAIAMAVFLVPQQADYARHTLSSSFDPTNLNILIPSGACVISDIPSVVISSDLYNSSHRGCPDAVDPYGEWLAEGPAHPPPYRGPYPATFVATWKQWLGRADFLVSDRRYSILIPWSPSLQSWFARNYTLVNDEGGFYVYSHVAGSHTAFGTPTRH